jgi:hypothetical protein
VSHVIDMTGLKIGRLTVLGYAGSKFRGRASRASWNCVCDCGAKVIMVGSKLRAGMQSCGCFSPSRFKKRKTPADDGGLDREKAVRATKPI